MQVKIDTKEKFHVITPIEHALPATMTDNIKDALLLYLQNDVKNVVISMENVNHLALDVVETLIKVQQEFYKNNASFVICCVHKELEDFLIENELFELLNVVPTQSEAADIVQMEEIERELMDEDY